MIKWRSHKHTRHKIFYRKQFREKTHLEGDVAPLSFPFWKYGYRYKEVMNVACRMLLCTSTLSFLYLLSLLAIFAQHWNKILSKE